MIDIRKILVRSSGKYQNQITFRFANGTKVADFKKRSLRATLLVTKVEDNTFRCQIDIVPNTTGRVSEGGQCMVHKAYKGADDEFDVAFTAIGRFGGRLADGEYAFHQTTMGEDMAKLTFVANVEQPVYEGRKAKPTAASHDELIKAIIGDDQLRAKLVNALIGSQPAAKAAVAAAPKRGGNFWGKNGLPPGMIKRIQSACKTMTPRDAAAALGFSEATVRKYMHKTIA